MLCHMYRAIQTVRRTTDITMHVSPHNFRHISMAAKPKILDYSQARIPQRLHRSVVIRAQDVSNVQNGHTKTLRICGQCPFIPKRAKQLAVAAV